MNEWIKARQKLIKEALVEGRLAFVNDTLMGRCEDCGQFKPLTPDHNKKRSQGGSHDKSNIDWVCIPCHNKRDQQGDPMGKKKSKKPAWQIRHKCRKCKFESSMYLCPSCREVSIK